MQQQAENGRNSSPALEAGVFLLEEDKIKKCLLNSELLDKIQKDLLSQLPGSPTEKKLKIKRAIRVLKNDPKLRKLITREESKER